MPEILCDEKKTLPTFGAHRGGCEVGATAGSVAVGLNKAALADENRLVPGDATHMPAALRVRPARKLND